MMLSLKTGLKDLKTSTRIIILDSSSNLKGRSIEKPYLE